jgi:hypothetical protein
MKWIPTQLSPHQAGERYSPAGRVGSSDIHFYNSAIRVSTKRGSSMMRTGVLFYGAAFMIFGGVVLFGENSAIAGAIDLPKTGQTTCYDSDGNVISCEGTGQDGDIRAGVAWPTPRFTDNRDGTMSDNLTGLMWLKDADCFGSRDWENALRKVKDFNVNPGNYACWGAGVTS